MPRKLRIEEVRDRFEKAGCKLLSETYNGVRSKLKYICSCGNKSEITYDCFRNGQRCKACGIEKIIKRKTYKIDKVRSIFSKAGCTLLTTKYKNSKQKLDFICSCGRQAKINLNNFNQGQRCSVCGEQKLRKARRLPFKTVKKEFANSGCTLLSKSYKNNSAPLRYICSCGTIAETSFKSFSRHHRCMKCGAKKRSGVNAYNYKPELSKEDRVNRRCLPEYLRWSKRVLKRDGYSCQCCGAEKIYLHAHHIYSYYYYPELRFKKRNGITLCRHCHSDFHDEYGRGGYGKYNTARQLEEFLFENKFAYMRNYSNYTWSFV